MEKLKIIKYCYKCNKKIDTIEKIGFEHEGMFLCNKCK